MKKTKQTPKPASKAASMPVKKAASAMKKMGKKK